MITSKTNTFCGFWPRTKENTYYGYKTSDNFYEWFKTKAAVLKRIRGTKTEYHRATLIGEKMYINLTYLTLTRW